MVEAIMNHEEIGAEAEAILRESGAALVEVKRQSFGWLVRTDSASGCTSDNPDAWRADAFRDPRDLARHMAGVNEDKQSVSHETEDEHSSMVGVGDIAPDAPDFGAEMLDAESEEAALASFPPLEEPTDEVEVAADLVGLEPVSPEAHVTAEANVDAPAYPGITILPDELGARRNAVLAAITARKVLLLDVAADPSLRDFLMQAFTDYQNLGALGQPIPGYLMTNYRDYLALQARDNELNRLSAGLERAALDADFDTLALIAAGLTDALR